MTKQAQILPAQGAEGSTKKPPSLLNRSSDPAPSLQGRSSDPAPSQRSRSSDPGPSQRSRPSDPAPSERSRPSDPIPSQRGRSSDPAPSQRIRSSDPAPSQRGRPSDPVPSQRGRPLEEAPTLPSRPLDASPSPRAPPSVPRSSLQPASSRRGPSELEASFAPRLQPTGPRQKVVDVTINWFFATFALLLVCAILALLVFIMSAQASRMSEILEERTDTLHVQILILSEILQELQMGKVPTCSMCRMPWVQHGDNCYLMRRRQMSWPSGMGYCKDKSSSLPVLNSSEEMDFLRHESKKYSDRYHKKLKFWMGAKYEPSTRKWLWTDGSVLNFKQPEELFDQGCIYLQNGKFHSQPCSEDAYVICQAKVQLG